MRLFATHARGDQAIVCSSPSVNGVRERKPNACSARLVSSLRRGWPFGLVVSQTILPCEAGQPRDRLDEILDAISDELPRFTGSLPL